MARLLHKPPTLNAMHATPPTSNATLATQLACKATHAMPPARYGLQELGSSVNGKGRALWWPGLNRRPQLMSSQVKSNQIKGRALLASIDMIVPGCVVSDMLPPSSAAALQSRVVIAGLYRHVETSRCSRVHAAYEGGDHC